MEHVSRGLIALLVATVAFAAVWFMALKPGSSSTTTGGTNALQSDVAAAHRAVTTANQAAAAQGGESATATPAAGASAPAAVSRPAQPRPPVAPVHPGPATRHRLDLVSRALVAHDVVALLFYNPAATDDRAVKSELATVPRHRGSVLKLAVPIGELARYPVVTEQVPVNQSPTLVLIDRAKQASTIVGFADRFEIAQRVLDALAVR